MYYSRQSADGRHLQIVSGEGVIHGDWCYLKNGKKKKVADKCFRVEKELEELPSNYSLNDFFDTSYVYETYWDY